eukprot:75483-Amphidinium_carterae.1
MTLDFVSGPDLECRCRFWRFSDLVTSCGCSTALKAHLSAMQNNPYSFDAHFPSAGRTETDSTDPIQHKVFCLQAFLSLPRLCHFCLAADL